MSERVEKTKSGRDVNHGLPSSYNNHKCRCAECTEAWSKYINERGYVRNHRNKVKAKKKTTNVRFD